MPILGFDSFKDMVDGGGAGRSGPTYSFEGSAFDRDGVNNYKPPSGSGSGGSSNASLLSGLGSVIGFVAAGPAGAALGAGLGNLVGGGSLGSSVQAGLGSLVSSQLGGVGGAVANALTSGQTPEQALQGLLPGAGGQRQAATGQRAPGQPAQQKPLGGILDVLNSPLVMAALLKATEPKNVTLTSPEQQRQLQTGERLPDYRGTPAFDYRGTPAFAKGGFVKGPGTGTSDSIPARIYQGGRPVQEARLSDGEFVMTNRAVRGAGNGDRAKGAAEMYRMMRQLERRA